MDNNESKVKKIIGVEQEVIKEQSKEDRLLTFLGGKFTLFVLSIVILIGISILIYTQISYIFTPIKTIFTSLVTPIILAYVFYYILNPLANLLNKKISRTLSSILAICLGVIAIFLIIVLAVPIVVEQTNNLIGAIPRYIEMVRDYLSSNSDNTYLKAINEYIYTNLNTSKIASQLTTFLTSFLTGFAGTISTTATVVMTFPFVLFFLLKDAGNFKKFLVSKLSPRIGKSLNNTLNEVDEKVGSYIQGQMLVSLCIGIMLFIGYNIIGLHYAVSLATLASVLSIVPYLGPILAILPAMLVAASTSWVMILKMLVVWGLVQFIEGNILSPNIMGKSLNMHPLSVIFVIIVGTNLAGVVGAILAIPMYSILKILIVKIFKRIKKRYDKLYVDN